MAKKSNKTEQVLKLITKDEEILGSFSDKEQPQVELSIHSDEPKEHKIETKLKIEIEPEIEIMPQKKSEEEKVVNVPINVEKIGCNTTQTGLLNLTERLVMEKVQEIMERLNVCSCPICREDVLALALNSLPQKYVTTDAGKQLTQLDLYKKQYETDVVAALTKACVRVKVSPRHEKVR